MTITVTGDAIANTNQILIGDGVTGTAAINGLAGGFVETITALEVGLNGGDGSLTLTGQNDGVIVTVQNTAVPGDPGRVGVGSGDGSTGYLRLESGALLISRNNAYFDEEAGEAIGGYLGFEIGRGGVGHVVADGYGTGFAAYGIGSRITVGRANDGDVASTLTIQNGAGAGAQSIVVGREAKGEVTVTGEYSTLHVSTNYGFYGGTDDKFAGALQIGRGVGGDGSLTLADGAIAYINNEAGGISPNVVIGRDAGSTGSVLVTGDNTSMFINSYSEQIENYFGFSSLNVGRLGQGELTISDNGEVYVGGEAPAVVTIGGRFFDAAGGTEGGTVTVDTGGTLHLRSESASPARLSIGYGIGGVGELTVTGDNSSVRIDGDEALNTSDVTVRIGVGGTGILQVLDGASFTVDRGQSTDNHVSVGGGEVFLNGSFTNASGNGSVLVDGLGSTFEIRGTSNAHEVSAGVLEIGVTSGSEATFTISGGATAIMDSQNSRTVVGNEAGTAGTLTVTGLGSAFVGGAVMLGAAAGVQASFNNLVRPPLVGNVTGGNGLLVVNDGATFTAESLLVAEDSIIDLDADIVTDITLDGVLEIAGDGVGAVDLIGDFIADTDGRLNIDITSFGDGVGDRMTIDGDADFSNTGGGIVLTVAATSQFDAGDTFIFATATGTLTSANFDLTDAITGRSFSAAAIGNDLVLTANEDQSGGLVLNGDGTNNLLTGSINDDLISGGDGRDTLLGEGGDDLLAGGLGNDVLNGGDDTDTVDYSDATGDTLVILFNRDGIAQQTLSSGRDTLIDVENIIGSNFNDRLFGDAGANEIRGGALNDTIDGVAGDDQLFGEGGNDGFRARGGTDLFDGGDDTDFVNYEASSGVNAFLDGSGTNGRAAVGDTFNDIENLVGSNTGSDLLFGDEGANRLTGLGGNDNIRGRAGIDQLEGGTGNDTLTGDEGADVYITGTGADTIVFNQAPNAAERDRITDFTSGEDVLQIDASVFGGGLVAGEDALLIANGNPSATTGDATFLYDTDNGTLRFDADGNGAGGAILFAFIQNTPTLQVGDFDIIA